MDVFGPPTISATFFGTILAGAGSPVLAERPAADYYALISSYQIDPAFPLSIIAHESGYGTNPQAVVNRYGTRNWSNTRSQRKPGLGATLVQTDRGQFAKYPTWYAGLDDLCYRLSDPTYAYQQKGARTVETIVPIMAPPGDMDNDPQAYVRAVVAQMTTWRAQDTSKAGGSPVALSKPTVRTDHPSPNHGYAGADYHPEAIVWHITDGAGSSALSWLTSTASGVSANYLIMEDGTLYELVNPEAGQQGAAWGNGAVNKPNLANPLIASWINGGVNPNRRTVSIEHAGKPHVALAAAQVASSIALTAWLCQRFGIAPDRTHIIPHSYFDSVDRPNCPGFSEQEWNSRVASIKALVAPLPQPEPPVQHAAGWLDPLVDTFDWTQDGTPGAGIVVHRAVRVYNDTERQFYEREWDGQTGFTPWDVVTDSGATQQPVGPLTGAKPAG